MDTYTQPRWHAEKLDGTIISDGWGASPSFASVVDLADHYKATGLTQLVACRRNRSGALLASHTIRRPIGAPFSDIEIEGALLDARLFTDWVRLENDNVLCAGETWGLTLDRFGRVRLTTAWPANSSKAVE